MSELQRLRDRVEELEALLGLTANIPDEIVPSELSVRANNNCYFGPKVKAIIGMLLARPFVSTATLFDAIYGAMPEADQPDMGGIAVFLSRARAILRAHGVTITTMWGKGWYLDVPNKQKLAAIICRLRSARDAASVGGKRTLQRRAKNGRSSGPERITHGKQKPAGATIADVWPHKAPVPVHNPASDCIGPPDAE